MIKVALVCINPQKKPSIHRIEQKYQGTRSSVLSKKIEHSHEGSYEYSDAHNELNAYQAKPCISSLRKQWYIISR